MENYFLELFVRDLTKLKDEVQSFKDGDNLWRKENGISNTAGTLVMHLVGNLNYSIGTVIGHTGYVRNRDYEFASANIAKQQLIADIENLIEVVKISLATLNQQKLDEQYPLDRFGQKSTAFYLSHFYSHLSYHLGQINYLRRILEA